MPNSEEPRVSAVSPSGRTGCGRLLPCGGRSSTSLDNQSSSQPAPRVRLATIAKEWTRIGCIGFGGPPAHIALFRRLCVDERRWLPAGEFEDALAATNLLPGPASTQLAIFCAWRLGGPVGAVVGSLGFILPGLVIILALSAVFLAHHPPTWILGAAAGAGAVVPAVAVAAAGQFVPASWARIGTTPAGHLRWLTYAFLGAVSAATLGSDLVLVILACGVAEAAIRREWPGAGSSRAGAIAVLSGPLAAGGLGSLVWVALKVGALSYGGGFVIIPLMQHDAVTVYHWLSGPQFLNAVALGQATPGPVVLTVSVVGYAAAGLVGGLLAGLVAFAPSMVFVLAGGRRFEQIRANTTIQGFLTGAGPSVVGAIAGSAIPLAAALGHLWQVALLACAAIWLLIARRGVVTAIVAGGAVGVIAVLAGAPVSR